MIQQTHHYNKPHIEVVTETTFNQPSDELIPEEFHSQDPQDTLDTINDVPPRDQVNINDSSITHADLD